MAVAYLLQEAVVLRQKKKSRQETSAWGKIDIRVGADFS